VQSAVNLFSFSLNLIRSSIHTLLLFEMREVVVLTLLLVRNVFAATAVLYDATDCSQIAITCNNLGVGSCCVSQFGVRSSFTEPRQVDMHVHPTYLHKHVDLILEWDAV
jgi:hypothetical protein